MDTTTLLIVVIGGVVITGLAVWLSILYKQVKKPTNKPFVINIASHLNNGRAYGHQISAKKGPGGRTMVTIMPRDIDPEKLKEGELIKPVSYVVDAGKRVPFPQSGWSDDVAIFLDCPTNAADFPEGWQNTAIGKLLMFYTEAVNADNAQLDALIEGGNRMRSHHRAMGDGEISVDRFKDLEEHFVGFVEAIKDLKGEKKTSSFTPPERQAF